MLNFKNKKITIMGLGLYEHGSGIAAARFLADQGAKLTITDLKTEAQLAPQLKRLKKFLAGRRVNLVLGEHREQDFKDADLIMKNPGVPARSPYLQLARDNHIPIETDISLFFQLVERKRIIAITGTRGKSTTTSLLYELIKSADKKAVLGGNITRSPLAQIKQVDKGGMIVLELSSWLLESLAPRKMSPHLAIFTNIYPDHLNTYDNIAAYAAAKENIFLWQTAQDCAVFNRDNIWTRKMGERAPGQRFWFSQKEFKEENGCFVRGGRAAGRGSRNGKEIWFRRNGKEIRVMPIKDIKMPGEHNLQNVLAAVCGAMIFGISAARARQIVSRFSGIPDRLEFLRAVKGVKYYNDTTSTTPEAGLAALAALSGGQVGAVGSRRLVLIAGGADKGLDFTKWLAQVRKKCRAVVLLKGTGTDRILQMRGKKKTAHEPMTVVDSMKKAVEAAAGYAKKGDIVLLSPACASFGLFNNEFDRGDQFKAAVKKLK